MVRVLRYVGLAAFIFALPARAVASPSVIDFESLSEFDSVTNQFAGLTFTNSTVFTAGSTLNEIDFPPHSGVNVMLDDGGPISIFFATPVFSFGGYFNYVTPITITAYGTGMSFLGSISSAFAINGAVSGDPGSAPNEFLTLSFLAGISSVTITGDPFGGSFFLDDVTTTPVATAVPEPGTLALVFAGIVVIARQFRPTKGV